MSNIFSDVKNIKKILRFILLSFSFSWIIWLSAILLLPEKYNLPFLLLGSFGPFVSAMIVIKKFDGKDRLKNWLKISFSLRGIVFWLIFGGIVFPFVIAALHHIIYLVLGGGSGFNWNQRWLIFIPNLIATALIGGGNEEPGWRGYLTPQLLKYFKPITACTIVGVVWVAWHLPLYVLKSWSGGDQPLYLFVLYAIPLSIILTWLYYKSKMSIIPVMLLHSGTNIVFEYFPRLDIVIQSMSFDFNILKVISYWIIAVILLISTKGTLGYQNEIK